MGGRRRGAAGWVVWGDGFGPAIDRSLRRNIFRMNGLWSRPDKQRRSRPLRLTRFRRQGRLPRFLATLCRTALSLVRIRCRDPLAISRLFLPQLPIYLRRKDADRYQDIASNRCDSRSHGAGRRRAANVNRCRRLRRRPRNTLKDGFSDRRRQLHFFTNLVFAVRRSFFSANSREQRFTCP